MMYNEVNTYDLIREHLHLTNDIKTKLIQNGCLYNYNKLIKLYNYLPKKYNIINIIINRDIQIILKVSDIYNLKDDIELAFMHYIINNHDCLNENEILYCLNVQNIGMLYNIEYLNDTCVAIHI